MSLLLIGDRPDVLLYKYQLLENNWKLNIRQCYSFVEAEGILSKESFDCLVYVSASKDSQVKSLLRLNRKFNVPVKIHE